MYTGISQGNSFGPSAIQLWGAKGDGIWASKCPIQGFLGMQMLATPKLKDPKARAIFLGDRIHFNSSQTCFG